MKVKLKQRENRLHKNPQNGHKSARGPHRRDVTHILSKVSGFLLKSFHFRRLRKRCFFPIQILIFLEYYATMPMLADAHIQSLGYLWRLFNETQQNFFFLCYFQFMKFTTLFGIYQSIQELLVYHITPSLVSSSSDVVAPATSRRMRVVHANSSLEIRIGGSSCRAQLFNN